MRRAKRTTRAAVPVAAAAVIAVAAATALAGVTVYKNTFSRKGDAKELRHSQGKHCKRSFAKRQGKLRIDVTKGPDACGYRPPVAGDTDGPDHNFQAKAKFLGGIPKGVRKNSYAAVAVRSGRSSGYELRVFPVRHRFRLVRSPSGGGGGFPAKGTSSAIKGFRKPNVLGLKAVGSRVIARVNGTKVARATDNNAAQVGGRKVEVTIGNGKRTRKTVSATLDDLRLQVPSP
jgi:hypothetical protein